MRQMATFVLVIVTILVAAVYLPYFYGILFFDRVEKTHLLFSPVTKRFIYMEKIVGPIPPEVARKSEDHHAEIAYRDANGAYYTRVEFEKNLPFIYYKNMELWGLLPLQLNGRVFDEPTIKKNRQVLELKPADIDGQYPHPPVWPLFESNSNQARLVFPEDWFRMTADAMQFINVDANQENHELTTAFTNALKENGFIFPARGVYGKFTILKPFDEGVFLVDAKDEVFHLKRRNGKPEVLKTPIDPALRTRHIKVIENQQRRYYGLLLAEDHSLHLLTYDNYRTVRLPVENYDAEHMDFKLLINPLYLTAVWSDDQIIQAVAMDTDYRPVDRYSHTMFQATVTPMQRLYNILFPFSAQFNGGEGGFARLTLHWGGLLSLIGIGVSLVGFGCIRRWTRHRWPPIAELLVVAFTGVYGWIALSMIELED